MSVVDDKSPASASAFDATGTGNNTPPIGLFRGRAGRRRRLVIVAVILVVICLYSFGSPVPASADLPSYNSDGTTTTEQPQSSPDPRPTMEGTGVTNPKNDKSSKTIVSKPANAPHAHPIAQLISDTEKSFKDKTNRQSKTLTEAVAHYRKRYRIAPPPNFDKWFEFAQKNNYQFIDEFDTIHENLQPFWSLKPVTIRNRAAEALGHANALIGISIRAGHVTYAAGPREWQVDATLGMITSFAKYLPDMDLAFNVNDEPRIQLQHDDMSRLVKKSQERMAHAASLNAKDLQKSWSESPSDLNAGKGFTAVKRTRFNEFSHQQTWTVSRMSCSPDSPARNLDDEGQDDLSRTCLSEMCFVQNTTALSDVCSSPSLATSYGFFVCPNAFTVSHDLIPIFSQSKYSTYADILYPSPWYWADKVVYNESTDSDWDKKKDDLYWRGSTTGGFSRWGSWRQQHRQRMVEGLSTIPTNAKVLSNTGTPESPIWTPSDVQPGTLDGAVDVSFSHVGQCDPGDCDAQKDFFKIEQYASQQDGWAHKFVLDIDGNAFSGRFYAFLQSKSLPLKYAIAREWHTERIIPWLHYVPITLRGGEWWELLRWLKSEGEGKTWSKKAAVEGQKWAAKALRKKDMEVWFFRLLLEYGRVVDDNRETIGFAETPAS